MIPLGLSHLREHKFKHRFQDTLIPICNYGNDAESAIHFFVHCPIYSSELPIYSNELRIYSNELPIYSNELRILLSFLVNTDHIRC